MRFKIVIIFILLIVQFGCDSSKESLNQEEYIKWINDPAHGLVKEKRVNGLIIKVKYMPQEILEYRNQAVDTSTKKTTISNKNSSKTFLLTLSMDEKLNAKGKSDLMMADVENMEDYREKFLAMHFSLGEYVELHVDSVIHLPTIFHLEPTYGLGKELVSTFVFSSKSTSEGLDAKSEYDFVFEDPFFYTGKNHFVFKKSHFDNIPSLKR